MEYDVIVTGAGHAGCEAALAAARMGLNTLVLTLSPESIGFMPCNPAIGGTSKGHLVREIDALGGQMALSADATLLQIKMLNISKGAAVHSLRAQSDKAAYQQFMRRTLERQEGLTVKQGEASEILTDNGRVIGIKTAQGEVFSCRAVVLATGVYMRSRIITGEWSRNCGPNGLQRSEDLSASMAALGIPLQRFKTGTPARVDGKTVDFSKMEPQYGDERLAFSFLTPVETRRNVPCWLTYTNQRTHQIILDNLDRSPMYSGRIKGTGTRYCPSIEDKIVRFKDKDRHQLFIEPEGEYTDEMYLQGLSTSLPADVQNEMIHSIAGLESAAVVRWGYAIEYDCIDPLCLDPTLGVKAIPGLYCAGQINGSSGYEEAAAQGLIAGINAALAVQGKPPLVLKRSDAYIGVLIDDLVTKGTNEPYRMMTSRAEFRLSLRQDNADLRLTRLGIDIGLADERRRAALEARTAKLAEAKEKSALKPALSKTNEILAKCGEEQTEKPLSYADMLKRANVHYNDIIFEGGQMPVLNDTDALTVETDIKYEGYLIKQQAQIKEMNRLENKLLTDIDYNSILGLRREAVQKLNRQRPMSIGQAGRISGVSPADIAVLLVYMEKHHV